MNWTNYERLENIENPDIAAVKDRGQARDYRDYVIANGGIVVFNRIRTDDDIQVGPERIKRAVANYDWFQRAELDGSAAVRITDAGRRSLVNDPHRSYEAIAGHPYGATPTGVTAGD